MLTSVTITDTTFKASAVGPIYMREPNPTEPANYLSPFTIGAKDIVDVQGTIHGNTVIKNLIYKVHVRRQEANLSQIAVHITSITNNS
jgi:hypothetical protein